MEGPYVRELQQRGLRLKFSNRRLESEFRNYQARKQSANLRVQLLLGGLMVCFVSLLDFLWLERAFSSTANILRIGVMLPPIVLAILCTYRPAGRRFLQPLGVVAGLVVGLGSLYIAGVGAEYGVPHVLAGYQIVTVFVYFFLGLRVGVAVGTAVTLFAAYVIAAILGGVDAMTTGYNTFYLLFLNIICAVGSYQLSMAQRTVFLEERVLSYRANHDALTQLPNRRAFDELLGSVWDNSQANDRPVALLMMDIDHFKSYNDLYGHQAGDHAISAVASILDASLQRPQDCAARYGGEEFVVLLFDSTKEYALQLAERIREEVMKKDIDHRGSSVARCVTISVGVAYIEPARSNRSMKGFVQMADEALYAAKEQGRNRIMDADLATQSTETGHFKAMKLDDPKVAAAIEARSR